jgi:hypothetical protein
MAHTTSNPDSSVAFNLQQLMLLEHERVQAEQAATAAAEQAAERARSEREARALAMRTRARAEREALRLQAQVAAEVAERAETERQAMLLRIRLQNEAVERSAHERASAAPQASPERRRARARWLPFALTAAIGCGLALGFGGRTQAPAVGVSPALAEQVARDRELAELRERVRALADRVAGTPAPIAAGAEARRPEHIDSSVAAPAPLRGKSRTTPAPRRSSPRSPAGIELDDLDSASGDPLKGL